MRTIAPRRALLVAPAALMLAACGQILGFPDDTLYVAGNGGSGSTSSSVTTSSVTTSSVTTSSVTTSSSAGGGSGGASSSSTGGGAGGGPCSVGATRACYDGPADTAGMGACKAGVQTCDGTTWGACTGQVLPAVEDCTTTAVDESCDGLPACAGTYRWAQRYGDATYGQDGRGVAVDAAGNLVVVGDGKGGIDFGGGPLPTSGNTRDVFIAVLDATGKHLWSKTYGDASSGQNANAVATDADRNIAVVGLLNGSIDFGGGQLTSPSGAIGFAAKLDKDGGHVWSKALGTAGFNIQAVSFDPAGDVILVGDYKGSPDIGTGVLPSAVNGARTFVAKLAKADGHALWVKAFTANQTADTHQTQALAVDGAGDIVVALTYTGSVIAPGQAAVTCVNAGGRVVKLAGADGAVAWAWGTCDTASGSSQLPSAVGVDATGDVFVAGSFVGTIDLGVGSPHPSAGASDIFFVKLDHASGAPTVGATYGNAASQRAVSLAVDAGGNVIITGPTTTGSITFGASPVTVNGTGAFLLKLDGQGQHVWSRGFSDTTGSLGGSATGTASSPGLATTPTGDIVWTTSLSGATDLGGGTLASAGNSDFMVAVFAP